MPRLSRAANERPCIRTKDRAATNDAGGVAEMDVVLADEFRDGNVPAQMVVDGGQAAFAAALKR